MDAFKCSDCHMTFGTVGLLQKHKRKFCVGGSLGDPDNLLLRKGLYSADTPRQRPLSPDDREYPHYNPNQEAQLRQLAENHGRQMEYLQIKNRDLEKQREDIRRRLEQLGQRVPGKDNSADLLAELRAQEERNQKSLNDLRRQLFEMGQKRVNVIEVEKPMNYPQPIIQQSLPPPPPQEKERKSYIYPVYYGSSLVAEISAMRQAYLQNGGNERDVLDQLSQMQAEAQRIEDEMKNSNYDNRHREKKPDLSGKMNMIEMENDRLHKELMLLQEQNFLSQNKRKSDREDELERELQRLREEQLRKMLELQNEIALLKQRALWERRPEPLPAPPPQPKNAEMPWLLQRPYVDVEPMQPYDQYTDRFNRQNLSSAFHTWVSTQSRKGYPDPKKIDEENENQETTS
ncbi:Hypothetical predicted protein [Mytilus galloprovincialis]|uniref:Uncharacterized protein n=1 Tax=Mytilus galloprovincialis TaxID=29158 RepID=A0A8B6ERP6_MYTGA|nr:Hypothetical predicted protein [Mytilus galloprovincialis]